MTSKPIWRRSLGCPLPLVTQNISMVTGGFCGPNIGTKLTYVVASSAKIALSPIVCAPQVFGCALCVKLSMPLSVLWPIIVCVNSSALAILDFSCLV